MRWRRKSGLWTSGTAIGFALLLATSSILAAEEAAAPMDHAAMASQYEAEAKAAKDKAAEHQLMLHRYKNLPMAPKFAGVPKEALVKHCEKLVENYTTAAQQAADLAKLHRQAAAASK